MSAGVRLEVEAREPDQVTGHVLVAQIILLEEQLVEIAMLRNRNLLAVTEVADLEVEAREPDQVVTVAIRVVAAASGAVRAVAAVSGAVRAAASVAARVVVAAPAAARVVVAAASVAVTAASVAVPVVAAASGAVRAASVAARVVAAASAAARVVAAASVAARVVVAASGAAREVAVLEVKALEAALAAVVPQILDLAVAVADQETGLAVAATSKISPVVLTVKIVEQTNPKELEEVVLAVVVEVKMKVDPAIGHAKVVKRKTLRDARIAINAMLPKQIRASSFRGQKDNPDL